MSVEPLYLDREGAATFLAISVSTLEQLGREDPAFPKPRAVSRGRSAWLVAELREWGLQRPVSTRLPPRNCRGRAREHAQAS